MTTLSFVPQLFFPDCMISDSADVSKGMTSSELIQVKQMRSGDWITAVHGAASRTGRLIISPQMKMFVFRSVLIASIHVLCRTC